MVKPLPLMFVLMLGWIGPPGPAAAATGQVAADEAAETGAEEEAGRNQAQIRKSIDKYRQRIARLQAEHGAYYPQLSEAMLSLGLSQSAVGEHAEAAETFRGALHISRVNHGLHSLQQLPLLELLIQENRALDNHEELYKNYHYLHWLYKRNYGSRDERILPVIYRIADWHIDTYRHQPDLITFQHLLEAKQLYEQAIEIIEEQYGEQDPRLIRPLYEIAMSHYYMAVEARREEEERGEFSAEMRGIGRTRYYDMDRDSEGDATTRALNSYYFGKRALKRVVAIHEANEDLPVSSRALALTHIGDWNMLFNRPRSALDRYGEAYSLLAENGADDDTIEDIFGKPRRLPNMPVPERRQVERHEAPAPLPEATTYAIVSFDVLSNGRTGNIRVVEVNPADDSRITRTARRMIAATRYRPRFESGKPVKTTDVNVKYILNE